MPTRNLVLTNHQEALIDELVASGRYQNASEVLREGLRLIERQEAERSSALAGLRKAAEIGFDAIARGEFEDFQSFEEMTEALTTRTDDLIKAQAGASNGRRGK